MHRLIFDFTIGLNSFIIETIAFGHLNLLSISILINNDIEKIFEIMLIGLIVHCTVHT